MNAFDKRFFAILLGVVFVGSRMVSADVIRTYYPDGKIKAEFQKEKGKLHGQTLWFYPDGNLGALMSYKNNQLHGKTETYYQNGQVKKYLYMRNNQAVGISENFDLEGKRKQREFYKDGHLASVWRYDAYENLLYCEEGTNLNKKDKEKWNLDLSGELK